MPIRETEKASIEAVARLVKTLLSEFDSASPSLQEFQKLLLERACRWLEKFIQPRVSEAAAELGKGLGLEPSVFSSATWFQQKTVLKDGNRELFHFEHMVPTTQLAKALIDFRSRSVDEIVAILAKQDIAWITKREDEELTKRGYRSKRLDPFAAYAEAGIVFVK